MVRRIKEKYDIKCRRHKRFKVTTDSKHNKLVYPNVLDQKFNVNRPNEAWVSDITYIWTTEGWLYLAGVKDLYTKELVGYAINKRMATDLFYSALSMAIKNKRSNQWLIVHFDRGRQYCSHSYHEITTQHQYKVQCSGVVIATGIAFHLTLGKVSPRLPITRSFDNAFIESFSGKEHCSARKNELVYHQNYKKRFEAISDIIGYIELYYHQSRIQKSLDYKPPIQIWFDFYRQAA